MKKRLKLNLPQQLKDAITEELLENPFMGINITDGEGQVLFLNEAHQRITGHSAHQYLGRT